MKKIFIGLSIAISSVSTQAADVMIDHDMNHWNLGENMDGFPFVNAHIPVMELNNWNNQANHANINWNNNGGNVIRINQERVQHNNHIVERNFEMRNGRVIRNEHLVNGVPIGEAVPNENVAQSPIGNPKAIKKAAAAQKKAAARDQRVERKAAAKAQKAAKKVAAARVKIAKKADRAAKKIAAAEKKIAARAQKAAAKLNRRR